MTTNQKRTEELNYANARIMINKHRLVKNENLVKIINALEDMGNKTVIAMQKEIDLTQQDYEHVKTKFWELKKLYKELEKEHEALKQKATEFISALENNPNEFDKFETLMKEIKELVK